MISIWLLKKRQGVFLKLGNRVGNQPLKAFLSLSHFQSVVSNANDYGRLFLITKNYLADESCFPHGDDFKGEQKCVSLKLLSCTSHTGHSKTCWVLFIF